MPSAIVDAVVSPGVNRMTTTSRTVAIVVGMIATWKVYYI
jgi:hypothetical protein